MQRFKIIIKFIPSYFESYIDIKVLKIIFDIEIKAKLKIFFGYQFISIIDYKRDSGCIIIIFANKFINNYFQNK